MEKKTVKKKWWFKLLIIVLSLGIAGGGGYLASTLLFSGTSAETETPVETTGKEVPVEIGEVSSTLEVSGTLTPNQQQSIKMVPNATITYMYVNPGDYVYAGNSLYNIKGGSTSSSSGQDLSSLTGDSETTTTDTVTTVKNDISGYITELNVTNGQTMTDGTQNAVVIIDSSLYYLKTMVEETDIVNVYGDQRAEIELKAFPGKMFPGRVIQIDSIGSTSTNTSGKTSYGVRILFEEVDPGFKPDMTGEGKIYLDRKEGVLRLPLNALVLTGDGKAEVTVKDDQGNLVSKEISVGLIGDNYVEITEGLVEGENVYIEVATEEQSNTIMF